MAVVATLKEADSGYDGNSQDTGSISVASGSAVLAWVNMSISTSDGVEPPDTVTASGMSLTWTKLVSERWASRRRSTLYLGTGTPSAGVITFGYTPGVGKPDAQEWNWQILEVAGVDGTDIACMSSDVINSGSSTSATATTTGASTDDAVISFLCLEDDNDASPEVAYTGLGTHSATSALGVRRTETAWDAPTSPDAACTWTWSGSTGFCVAAVVAEDDGGGAPAGPAKPLGLLMRGCG